MQGNHKKQIQHLTKSMRSLSLRASSHLYFNYAEEYQIFFSASLKIGQIMLRIILTCFRKFPLKNVWEGGDLKCVTHISEKSTSVQQLILCSYLVSVVLT